MKASQVKYLIPVFFIGIAAIIGLSFVDWEYLGMHADVRETVIGFIIIALTMIGAGIGLGIGHVYFGLDLVFFEEKSRSTTHGWSYNMNTGQYVPTSTTTVTGEYKSVKGNPNAPFFKYRYIYLASMVTCVIISLLFAASMML